MSCQTKRQITRDIIHQVHHREITRECKQTPLVNIGKTYAKLECRNPAGSIKHRIAKYIVDESEKSGLLRPGMTIVEATSGNTGIAYAHYAKQKGYKVIIVMPENMSEERKSILRQLGAELRLCAAGNFAEAAKIRDSIASSNPSKYYNPDQFSNPLNTRCHYETTAMEVLSQLPEGVVPDAVVAGVGTGGTLMGLTQRIREVNPGVHVVAVEPAESAVMSGGKPGLHDIQGIGDGFIPPLVLGKDKKLHRDINEVIAIRSSEAIEAARELSRRHNICTGISSGANWLAARQLENRGYSCVVTAFPDGFQKYQSFGLKRSCSPSCAGSCISNMCETSSM